MEKIPVIELVWVTHTHTHTHTHTKTHTDTHTWNAFIKGRCDFWAL